MIRVSAPGKLLLMGDHAVVYGFPCIVTAINIRLQVTIEETETHGIQIHTPGNGNHAFISEVISYASSLWKLPLGFSLTTNSPFTGKYGFGSSSAVTVASLTALAEMAQVSLSQKELFQHAYNVVLNVQGVGSGFDVASAIYGKTIVYQNKGEVIEPIPHQPYDLVVGYSGNKADTVEIVKNVATKKELYPQKIDKIFSAIGELVRQAKEKMMDGDYERVGKCMDYNQEYLRDLGVSSEKLESLISVAKSAGAWGAKLSGAGGGDCMVALVPPDKAQQVTDAIVTAGGEVVPVMVDEEGVRLERINTMK